MLKFLKNTTLFLFGKSLNGTIFAERERERETTTRGAYRQHLHLYLADISGVFIFPKRYYTHSISSYHAVVFLYSYVKP